MSLVVEFPDGGAERLWATLINRCRRESALAGMKAPEAQMQHALDVLVPGICEYLAADAALKVTEGR